MGISSDAIRNVALVGHGGSGKTTLTEHLLYRGGVIGKAETVESGKTVSDYMEEEVGHGFSVHTSLSSLGWKDHKINLLDTPGAADFVGEVVTAFRAAETALVVINGRAGVQIETIKLWRRLNNRNKPRIAFVNRMNEDRASYATCISDLQDKFQLPMVPITIPMGEGTDFRGVINLIEMKAYFTPESGAREKSGDIPQEYMATANEYHARMIETAALGDDELTEKYLETEDLTIDQARKGLMEGLRDNRIVPVLSGAGLLGSGIESLLNFLVTAAPSPAGLDEVAIGEDDEHGEQHIPINVSRPFSGYIFKTTIDQFSGKLSFLKVVTGKLFPDGEATKYGEGRKERFSKVYSAVGKKLVEETEVVAGDLCVVTKVASAHTNDTFHDPAFPVHYKPLALPQPVFSVAITGESKKDEDKIGEQLARMVEQDHTLRLEFNPETRENVFSGMGELHINLILDQLREKQKIGVQTKVPRVAYRETITKKSSATYRHKKQTGGHGQFGEVAINVRPIERGQHYEFANIIKGGSVSKGYIPGIEKGFHEAMESGVLANYPVVDVGIELYDGKEHAVDSSEMAFKMAARGALRDAMEKAGPVLLEPVMSLKVFVDEQYLGDVLSDLSTKRARVLGQESLGGGIIEIDAEVPQAEMLRYAIDLKSITSGTGGFEMEFNHYSPISGKIAQDVISAAQEEAAAS